MLLLCCGVVVVVIKNDMVIIIYDDDDYYWCFFEKTPHSSSKECKQRALTALSVVATAALSLYNFYSCVITMSKSDFDSAYRPKRFLDVIEPQWLQDTLSDDEVEIPLGIDTSR